MFPRTGALPISCLWLDRSIGIIEYQAVAVGLDSAGIYSGYNPIPNERFNLIYNYYYNRSIEIHYGGSGFGYGW